MANPDARFGFRPLRHLNGAAWNGKAELCYISPNYATALFIGDPVDLDTTLANKDPLGMYPTIIKATAGDGSPIFGVIIGFQVDPDNTSRIYSPASTGAYALVVIDPSVIYLIRDDGAAALTSVTPGQNANFIATHAGDTVSGLSGVELDTNSDPPAADASNQLLVLKAHNRPDNSLAARCLWEVLINLHRLGANGGATGALGVTAA
jgi:hypothetical protein